MKISLHGFTAEYTLISWPESRKALLTELKQAGDSGNRDNANEFRNLISEVLAFCLQARYLFADGRMAMS